MKKNETHRGFSLKPAWVTDQDGTILDKGEVFTLLRNDLKNMQALVQWEIDNNGAEIVSHLDKVEGIKANVAGRRLGVSLPLIVKNSLFGGRSGLSRYEHVFRGEVVSICRSWKSRIDVSRSFSKTYVSAGFKRTARDTKPTVYPQMNLAFADSQYVFYTPEKALNMVIGGEWFMFHFNFPERFNIGKVSLPKVQLNRDNSISFYFDEITPYQQCDVSERYFVGVDVGKVWYACVSVWDIKENRIVFSTNLSQRVHSLWNSIQASEKQIKALYVKGTREALGEVRAHREANVRKKRELAILVGQEVAEVAFEWGNAVVAVEDLSWVKNTMANGRWNRGEVVKWIRHYVEQNGSRVVKVNAAGTSQFCSSCGVKGYCDGKTRLFHCSNKLCGLVVDRDVNAAGNIAFRCVSSVGKMVLSRKKSKSYKKGRANKCSPVARSSLRYPGRDRTKTGPTPKRVKKNKSLHSIGEVKQAYICPREDFGSTTVARDEATGMTSGLFKSDTLIAYAKPRLIALSG